MMLRLRPMLAVLVVLAALVRTAPAEPAAAETVPTETAVTETVATETVAGTPIVGARERIEAGREERQPGGSSGLGFAQVALALTGVIALILLIRWGAGRVVPGMSPGTNSRAMQVLVRGAIGPRQQVIIFRVGRRIVVAGSAGGQLTTLCQITDPQESAELIGQIESEKGESITRAFTAMFTREREKFDDGSALPDAEVPAAEDPAVEQVRGELGGLMEKVRLVSRQFRA